MDSPVTADVSRLERPSTTTPSVATRSPAPTTRMSSSRTSEAGIVRSLSRRETRAVSGIRDSSARRPSFARSIARSSRASARENKNASVAASPTWPSSTAPIAAIVISSPTPRRPRRSRRTAPGTNVYAPATNAADCNANARMSSPDHLKMYPTSRNTPESTEGSSARSRHQAGRTSSYW